METIEDPATVADVSVTAEDWLAEIEAGFAYIAGRFGRVEARRRARAYLLGLLSDVDTGTCWQSAERAGDRSPPGMGGHHPPDAEQAGHHWLVVRRRLSDGELAWPGADGAVCTRPVPRPASTAAAATH